MSAGVGTRIVTLVLLLVAGAAAGCASPQPEAPQRQPYKVVLLPVEGAEQALAAVPETASDGGVMVPLALTPAELQKTVFDGVLASNAFSEIVAAPASVGAVGGTFAGDELAAAADFARSVRADLILRVTVRSARIRDLGHNGSTFWSAFTWFMLPLPIWGVDDRTYDTNLSVEAALYEPRDTIKPTASVVAASSKQELDLWDRGLSPLVIIVPPPYLAGNEKTVSEEVTRRAVAQVMAALSEELRSREIPARFDLDVTTEGRDVKITVATRRQLRSLDVFVDGKLVKSWAETDLVAEPDSTDDRRVYRRAIAVPAAAGQSGRGEVRVAAEDESGGREVRTILVGGDR